MKSAIPLLLHVISILQGDGETILPPGRSRSLRSETGHVATGLLQLLQSHLVGGLKDFAIHKSLGETLMSG